MERLWRDAKPDAALETDAANALHIFLPADVVEIQHSMKNLTEVLILSYSIHQNGEDQLLRKSK